MPEIELSPKERQALKGQAHALDPVVLLGAQGLTAAVIREIDRALTAHALIKVRVPGDEREERDAMFRRLADELNAARVQSIGKLLVLFRPRAEEAQARHDEKAAAVARAQQRSKKAPADVVRTKKAAGSLGAATKPGRRDIRQAAPRTSAPRKTTGGRARSR
ncbi:MAG: ribosome assembly RNA-binding protein YhbY [Burkholderiaceae bacterium]|nr:ribosome assembly RNA-binding protein YhbY [Burkholderiaceae bacterium]